MPAVETVSQATAYALCPPHFIMDFQKRKPAKSLPGVRGGESPKGKVEETSQMASHFRFAGRKLPPHSLHPQGSTSQLSDDRKAEPEGHSNKRGLVRLLGLGIQRDGGEDTQKSATSNTLL